MATRPIHTPPPRYVVAPVASQQRVKL